MIRIFIDKSILRSDGLVQFCFFLVWFSSRLIGAVLQTPPLRRDWAGSIDITWTLSLLLVSVY